MESDQLVMSSTHEEHSFNVHKTIGILGIIVLLAGFWLYASILLTGPQPTYRDYDPQMAYFLNSLAPFRGAAYFYTDHPGTPLEMIGTTLLGIPYVFFPDHANFVG
jgi:hypothetical protein